MKEDVKMDGTSHGPGGDEGSKVPGHVEVSEPVASSRAPATEALLMLVDEGQKKKKNEEETGQVVKRPALKKPDKLAPCPRCDSLDTKFCYYNNYNVNQPRHFCKNCQRYWTAGGTLRNVPVGAGRRKNKHGSLQARHSSLPTEHLPAARLDRPCVARSRSAPDHISPPLVASSSSDPILPSRHERGSSGHAATHASSMLTVEPLSRHSIQEPQASISSDPGGSRMHDASCDPERACEAEKEDCTEACTSSAPGYSTEIDAVAQLEVQSTIRVPATGLQPVVAGVVRGVDGSVWTAAPAPFGLFNGSWPFGYNVGWSGPPPGTPGTPLPGGALVACQPAVAGIWPGVCWGSALIPGMPPGLVGSPWMSPGWGGGWSIPWGAPDAATAAAAAAASSKVAAVSPTGTVFPSRLPIRPVLSKHPRDRLELERVESSLWVPKMVRFDDPVPRSSVWTAVGGAEVRPEPGASGSNFKAFLPVRDNTTNASGFPTED